MKASTERALARIEDPALRERLARIGEAIAAREAREAEAAPTTPHPPAPPDDGRADGWRRRRDVWD